MYLPPEAQDRLLDDITALSAPGSRVATEHMDMASVPADWAQRLTERSQRIGSTINLAELFYMGDRNSAADYLTATVGRSTSARPSKPSPRTDSRCPMTKWRLLQAVPDTSAQSSSKGASWHARRRHLGSGLQRRRDGDDGRRATRAEPPRAVDRRPVRRTAGARRWHRLHDQILDGEIIVRRRRPELHGAAGRRGHGRTHPLLRSDVHRRRQARGQAGRDPGCGSGRAGLPIAVAGRHRGLRGRPAGGHRVQDADPGRTQAPPRRRRARSWRSTCGKTGRRRCWTTVSIRSSRRRGARRGC